VIGFLRFLGVVNAAIWLGAAVFFTLGAGPAVFSDDMKTLLGPNNYPYFSGAIAQVVIARYFKLQLVCMGIAVVHLFAEWIYASRPLRRLNGYLVLGLVVFGLAGDLGLQPQVKRLHRAKYAVNATLASRERAAYSLRLWHGAAQGINLLLLAGLLTYLWRAANPDDPSRLLRR
jgi:hypothetical protein